MNRTTVPLAGLSAALGLLAATPALGQTPESSGDKRQVIIQMDEGRPHLSWPTEPGRMYVIETTDDLSSGDWESLGMITAEEATTHWRDAPDVERQRFYRVRPAAAEIGEEGRFVHASSNDGLLQDLGTASFATARDRILQMGATGEIVLPIPVPDLDMFDDIEVTDLTLSIDAAQRTIVIKGTADLLDQAVELYVTATWDDDTSPPKVFTFAARLPEFRIKDFANGLSGTVFEDFEFGGSVITLANAALRLDPGELPGGASEFYGDAPLDMKSGLNLRAEVDLAAAPALQEPLDRLGFTDTTVLLEGFLGVDANALFQDFEPQAAPLLELRAHLPTSDSSALPNWVEPRERVLEFTNDPSVRVRLLDTLDATTEEGTATFNTVAEIDTEGEQTEITVSGELAEPWAQTFGVSWLTLEEASLELVFTDAGAGEVAVAGIFAAGEETVTVNLTVFDTESGPVAAATGSVDRLNVAHILEMLATLTGADPFGPDLPDDALEFSDVEMFFDTSDERSLEISATSTILGEVETDVLFTFVKPTPDTALLVLGMNVHNFQLSALYSGIDGTLAGDLAFPGAAFTVVQELPDDLPDAPDPPFEVSSDDLNATARSFYGRTQGAGPFTLEFDAGLNFSGAFAQSALPPVVLDAFGMDPSAVVLLEGGLALRLGALTGEGAVALDELHLTATLPPPARARPGFPDWLANLESGERILEFVYEAPDIRVGVIDAFRVELDGAMRDFVTSATLETDGEDAEVEIAGSMERGWEQPFGIEWLDLDTVDLTIAADETSANAALHSSFELAGKEIALAMAVSGSESNRSVRISGSVDSLSMSDFTELARRQAGTEVDPFGDGTIDFTFTDVSLTVEAGTRSSFSLGGTTSLQGKTTEALFSLSYPSDGGAPQFITGFRMDDWSLADSLEAVEGTLVEELRMDSVALIFSNAEGDIASSDMNPETRTFYGSVYGTNEFDVSFRPGLSLIGVAPMSEENPLYNGLDALGTSTNSLLLGGTVPGGIIGLGGGGGALDGLSLQAGLPPVSPPDSPDWFVAGELALEITATPSVGFVGEITVKIEDEILTFSVAAAFQRAGPNVEFSLAGGLKAEDPWDEPFGIEWLIFNEARVRIAVNAAGGITLGFAGDMIVGEKDIDVAVATTVNAVTGVPTNFIFDGASEAGLEMADLVALQAAMARADDPGAPAIPLDSIPQMAVRDLHLKFAPRADPDLGVEAGFAIVGDLWIPDEANGPPERNFAGVELSVDTAGIIAMGHLGAFVVGPVDWDDAIVDLELSLPEQHFFVSGAATVGDLFDGDLDLGLTRDGLEFRTSTTIFEQFEAQLHATGEFDLSEPEFTVHGVMTNDFNGAIVSELTTKVKIRAQEAAGTADRLLRRGLDGWSAFRNNPHSLNFGVRVAGFADAAGWPSGQWETYVLEIQHTMEDLDALMPDPDNLLDLALGGVDIPGVPGVRTRNCAEWEWQGGWDGSFVCVRYVYRCNGFVYDGGECWTVEPRTIGGACNEPSLSEYNIPCSSTPFINRTLIPPLISRIDTILENAGRAPMIVIERAEFTRTLAGLLSSPEVTLSAQVKFMDSDNRLQLTSDWNFDDRNTSVDALRDALVDSL